MTRRVAALNALLQMDSDARDADSQEGPGSP
jgi:hypothetical protein